ncbi:MAG: MmcQ/YjbR family DNA-binding protein [Deltaproteobacteria bacterium]|nr:MmcQ/YjbR family DNA-binding protein [Deltaproteobacteria bacterium]
MPDLNAEITPELQLRAAALAYPEAAEEFPWGERVIKVRGKIFLFLGAVEGRLRLSVKLPQSFLDALTVPGAQPTGYGLGKAGWVSLWFDEGQPVPMERLTAWINESYRAVAPKRLVKSLDGG